ncbi:MAG: sporulation transcription factor Spo0A [Ruminococcus flavefaciens]|nr:sporulation transcription factor Spo0A [Ruminococcus flavefaciens]MCM1231083.1 sporulation transcription factor Spo0A [Ruminococcus flavefaciens]
MENKIKVLICDDTISGTRMSAELNKLGLSAFTRKNNKETILRSVIKDKPDVVVIDLSSCGGDAFSVVRTTKMILPVCPAFVVFSDIYNSFIEKQVIEAGAMCFLFSPFNSEELHTAVMSAVQKKQQEQCNAEVMVTSVMQKLGVPANVKGYRYIRTAVLECVGDCNCLNSITKSLYPIVAQKHETTAPRVERAIRHAIYTACQRGNKVALDSFFGYSISSYNQPTNSEFISLVTDKVQLLMKSGNSVSYLA